MGKEEGGWVTVTVVAGAAVGCMLYVGNWIRTSGGRFTKSKAKRLKKEIDLIRKYEQICMLPKGRLDKFAEEFMQKAREGLKQENQMLKMLPSFVEKLPTGAETGEYLAVDLGGTNMRVVKVVLANGRVEESDAVQSQIPPDCMTGTVDQLFAFIASEIDSFVKAKMPGAHKNAKSNNKISRRLSNSPPLPIGFTFSYPMKQQGLKQGTLVCWTKGFDIPDAVGRDVVKELQSALRAGKVPGRIEAVLNDTVGTLAASSFVDQDTMIGVILGTGSNAAYIESMTNVTKLTSSDNVGERKMVINIEWGDFKSDCLPYTKADRDLDKVTPNPGQQHLEKLISGMYLGEIVRRILVHCAHKSTFLKGQRLSKLSEPWSFPSSMVSKLDGFGFDHPNESKGLVSEALELTDISEMDLRVVIEICRLIGTRSARLAAGGIVAIYKLMLESGQAKPGQRVVVAIDGGLFKHYPNYETRMSQALRDMLGERESGNLCLVHASDGSGIGAAVIAAAAVGANG